MERKGWIIGVVIAAAAGLWWYNTQSGVVPMTDGIYECRAAYVNSNNKYQLLTLDDQTFEGYIKVEGGEVASLSAPSHVLEWDENPDLTYANKGRKHIRITDGETYGRTRYAFACDLQD